MDINELTIGQAKELASSFGGDKSFKPNPFRIGQAYFIRTVTYRCTGRVIRIEGEFLVLKEAAMIADSRRFFGFLTDWANNNAEIEPFTKEIYVNMGAITDATLWVGELPEEQQGSRSGPRTTSQAGSKAESEADLWAGSQAKSRATVGLGMGQ